jgi:hypothetical protein
VARREEQELGVETRPVHCVPPAGWIEERVGAPVIVRGNRSAFSWSPDRSGSRDEHDIHLR